MKAKQAARRRPLEHGSSRSGLELLRALSLGAIAALSAAIPLLPTETVMLGGGSLAVILLWILLLVVWALSQVLAGKLECRGGMTFWMLALFLGWHSLSAIVMSRYGHPRSSINMLWQWISFGLVFFVTRQLARTAAERRALVALMMGLAVSLSVLGYYQYFYEHPAMRREYLRDPEKMMRDAGIAVEPGGAQRASFENRLFSTEPFATFALANSFAGFLTPWLIIAIGIGMTNLGKDRRSILMLSIVSTLLIAGCMVLTKSRSAWLASAGGLVLLGIYSRRSGWKPDWRWIAGLVGAAVLLPTIGFVVGGLDAFVFLEASKSIAYRVEYWRAAAGIIGDHPWFGCGPGNFQQYYTGYKLPQASETIAEPHNFIFEIWSTAGTPALVFFLGFLGAVVWQVWRGLKYRAARNDESEQVEPAEVGEVRAVYWGGLAGILFGYAACTLLEGYAPSPSLLAFGIPIGAVIVGFWHGWVMDGRWPVTIPVIAIVTLLTNLLAAGGIGFAGVAQSFWLLAALLLNEAESPKAERLRGRSLDRRWSYVAALVAVIGLVAFTMTTYLPQLRAQRYFAEGSNRLAQRRGVEAVESFRKAAEADPYSPQGWERLADLSHAAWLATGEETHRHTFAEAAQRAIDLNSHSSTAHAQTGHWWLAAYRKFGEREFLDQAISAYRVAIKLYPNYNLGHAQLSWALHLAGDTGAADEAAEALRLDALHSHSELKLARQQVYDTEPGTPDQPKSAGPRNAEQLMVELRKAKGN